MEEEEEEEEEEQEEDKIWNLKHARRFDRRRGGEGVRADSESVNAKTICKRLYRRAFVDQFCLLHDCLSCPPFPLPLPTVVPWLCGIEWSRIDLTVRILNREGRRLTGRGAG